MTRAEPPVEVEVLERALLDGVLIAGGERARLDVGLVPVFREERPLLGLAGLMDWRGCGRLSALFRSGFGSASFGEQLLLPCDHRLPVARLVLVGLGSRTAFDNERASEIARRLVTIVRGLRAQSVLLALPCAGVERSQTEALFAALLGVLRESSEAKRTDAGDGGADQDSAGDSNDPDDQAAPASQRANDPSNTWVAPRWWVAADEGVVARLRRLIAGPPRAARGTGLHT